MVNLLYLFMQLILYIGKNKLMQCDLKSFID